MQKVKKHAITLLVLSILSSVLFVAGIPMICMGAVKGISVVLILGIVLTAVDFYAIPLLWIAYAGKLSLKRLVFAITQEHILSVSDLSVHLSSDEKSISQSIKICVNKGYLAGYFFDGKQVMPNRHRNPDEEMISAECKFCGAKFAYRAGDAARCPYCDSYVRDATNTDGK